MNANFDNTQATAAVVWPTITTNTVMPEEFRQKIDAEPSLQLSHHEIYHTKQLMAQQQRSAIGEFGSCFRMHDIGQKCLILHQN